MTLKLEPHEAVNQGYELWQIKGLIPGGWNSTVVAGSRAQAIEECQRRGWERVEVRRAHPDSVLIKVLVL